MGHTQKLRRRKKKKKKDFKHIGAKKFYSLLYKSQHEVHP